MEIPDELDKLLAELRRDKTADKTGSPDRRPSTSEVDQFLSKYGFDKDVNIERIEITDQGVFQCYMFAVWQPETEELSLFQMTERS